MMETKLADTGSADLDKLMHKTIKGISEDMERLTFNTAIAKLMEFTNAVYKSKEPMSKETAEKFVLLLAPMAPHIAEELWQKLGHADSIAYADWPSFDEAMTRSVSVSASETFSEKSASPSFAIS